MSRTISASAVLMVLGLAGSGILLWQRAQPDHVPIAPSVVGPRSPESAESPKRPVERVESDFKDRLDSPVLPPAELPLPPDAIHVVAPDPVTISNPPAHTPLPDK
jgi:hypothetical protein